MRPEAECSYDKMKDNEWGCHAKMRVWKDIYPFTDRAE